jgi:hypothetical protein
MVKAIGNAASGYTYNAPPPDLPRGDRFRRPAHRPWCAGCKRKDRQLDNDQLCEPCARAAVTRAAQRERWKELEKQEAAAARERPAPKPKRRTRRGPRPGAVPVRRPSKSVALLDDLGVSAREVKDWALAQGLLSEVVRGRVPREVASAYADAHQRGEVA